MLLAAAQLPVTCPRERCDVNLDNEVSVGDGVLALRVAADLRTEIGCSAEQADAIFSQIKKTVNYGRLATSAARARAAGTTTPCSGGGSQNDDGSRVTFVDCNDGDFVTNGSIAFTNVDAETLELSFETSDFAIGSGETFDTRGTLTFTIFEDGTSLANGELSHSSSIFGDYADRYVDLRLDADFDLIDLRASNRLAESGRIFTTVVAGRGPFANVQALDSIVLAPALASVIVTYANLGIDVFTVADGLCEACTTGCANSSLTCVPCVDQCNGATDRCGGDFAAVACTDGIFGPAGLCAACNSNDQCNTGEQIGCFECTSNCFGATPRCSSVRNFIECEDGLF